MTNTMKKTRRAGDGSGRSRPKQGRGGTKRDAKDTERGRSGGRKPAGRGRVAGGKAKRAGRSSTEENWAKRAGGALLPRSKREACGAMVVVAEGVGGDADIAGRACRIDLASDGNGVRRGGEKGASNVRRAVRLSAGTWRMLAAVGHEQRGRLLTKLVEGPATYRTLQLATKLKPGPLYHHINQLRLAGLILPKQRDLYELTRGGRNLILAVMAMAPLIRDSRRRPLATE